MNKLPCGPSLVRVDSSKPSPNICMQVTTTSEREPHCEDLASRCESCMGKTRHTQRRAQNPKRGKCHTCADYLWVMSGLNVLRLYTELRFHVPFLAIATFRPYTEIPRLQLSARLGSQLGSALCSPQLSARLSSLLALAWGCASPVVCFKTSVNDERSVQIVQSVSAYPLCCTQPR